MQMFFGIAFGCYLLYTGISGIITGQVYNLANNPVASQEVLLNTTNSPWGYYISILFRIFVGGFLIYVALFKNNVDMDD